MLAHYLISPGERAGRHAAPSRIHYTGPVPLARFLGRDEFAMNYIGAYRARFPEEA